VTEKNLNEEELTREETAETAERLEELARELCDEIGNVYVGNKTIRLSPPETVAYEIGVRERSSLLRGNHEMVTIKMGWKPETSE
jgi:amphi-Trp domain-containing protein